jgi:serine/threonine protein kinase
VHQDRSYFKFQASAKLGLINRIVTMLVVSRDSFLSSDGPRDDFPHNEMDRCDAVRHVGGRQLLAQGGTYGKVLASACDTSVFKKIHIPLNAWSALAEICATSKTVWKEKHGKVLALRNCHRIEKNCILLGFDRFDLTLREWMCRTESATHQCLHSDSLSVMKDIATGLAYLHDAGWIHGDISSLNIMITYSESRPHKQAHARLVDFGTAHIYTPNTQYCTFSNSTTAAYTAPERLGVIACPTLFSNNHKPPTDVWAMGCVFADMLCASSTGFPSMKDQRHPLLVDVSAMFDPDNITKQIAVLAQDATCVSETRTVICKDLLPWILKARSAHRPSASAVSDMLMLKQYSSAQSRAFQGRSRDNPFTGDYLQTVPDDHHQYVEETLSHSLHKSVLMMDDDIVGLCENFWTERESPALCASAELGAVCSLPKDAAPRACDWIENKVRAEGLHTEVVLSGDTPMDHSTDFLSKPIDETKSSQRGNLLWCIYGISADAANRLRHLQVPPDDLHKCAAAALWCCLGESVVEGEDDVVRLVMPAYHIAMVHADLRAARVARRTPDKIGSHNWELSDALFTAVFVAAVCVTISHLVVPRRSLHGVGRLISRVKHGHAMFQEFQNSQKSPQCVKRRINFWAMQILKSEWNQHTWSMPAPRMVLLGREMKCGGLRVMSSLQAALVHPSWQNVSKEWREVPRAFDRAVLDFCSSLTSQPISRAQS